MDNDDAQVGRVLSRREVLALFGAAGAAGAALLIGCSGDDRKAGTSAVAGAPENTGQPAASPVPAATAPNTAAAASVPACVVRPALTEGPYFVDEKLNRSDIRSDPGSGAVKAGVPLTLTFNVSKVGSSACQPLANATVDVWHCDALGVYSDAADPGFSTKGQKFLRGYQVTNNSGKASFQTIYPGWYQGRAVHIHFKVRSGNAEFTSQLFFDEAVSAQVFAQPPYSQKGQGWVRNSGDSIFRDSKGLLTLAPEKTAEGYAATFDIGLS
jgi:protocatechuate 3,4-dioxygenase beta subunit